MRGIIQRYSKSKKSGVIIAKQNNTKYTFEGKDFKATGNPKAGMRVEFSVNGLVAQNINKDISANLERVYKQKNTNSELKILFGNKIIFAVWVMIAIVLVLLFMQKR